MEFNDGRHFNRPKYSFKEYLKQYIWAKFEEKLKLNIQLTENRDLKTCNFLFARSSLENLERNQQKKSNTIFVNLVKSQSSAFFAVEGTSANNQASSDTVQSPLRFHLGTSISETGSRHQRSQHAAGTPSTPESSISLSRISSTDSFSIPSLLCLLCLVFLHFFQIALILTFIFAYFYK